MTASQTSEMTSTTSRPHQIENMNCAHSTRTQSHTYKNTQSPTAQRSAAPDRTRVLMGASHEKRRAETGAHARLQREEREPDGDQNRCHHRPHHYIRVEQPARQ